MNKPIPLVLDTFTDTNGTAITSHTGDSGNTWIALSINSGALVAIYNNSGSITTLNGGYATGSGLILSTDVSAMVEFSPQSSEPGLGILINAIASSSTGYIAIPYDSAYHIYKAPAFTSLGSASFGNEFLTTDTAADTNTIRLIRRTSGGAATVNLVVNGRQVLSVTDSSPLGSLPAGLYGNDNGTGMVDNFRVFPASAEIGVCLLGDSITWGATPGDTSVQLAVTPDVGYGNELSKGPNGLPILVSNQAVSGTTTGNWNTSTGGASLSSALAAIPSTVSYRFASIMLGANDCKSASRVTAAQHQANVQGIISQVLAAGYTGVILNRTSYLVNGALSAWDALSSLQYLPDYWAAEQALVNNTTVFEGDSQWFDLTAQNPSAYLGDGVHPTQAYSRMLSQLWANQAHGVFVGAVGLAGASATLINT